MTRFPAVFVLPERLHPLEEDRGGSEEGQLQVDENRRIKEQGLSFAERVCRFLRERVQRGARFEDHRKSATAPS